MARRGVQSEAKDRQIQSAHHDGALPVWQKRLLDKFLRKVFSSLHEHSSECGKDVLLFFARKRVVRVQGHGPLKQPAQLG